MSLVFLSKSDLIDLHCLQFPIFRLSRQDWINYSEFRRRWKEENHKKEEKKKVEKKKKEDMEEVEYVTLYPIYLNKIYIKFCIYDFLVRSQSKQEWYQ